MPDLKSLTGDDLWNALKALPSKPPKKAKAKPKRPRLTWGDTALVMLIHRTECSCGHSYEHPNDHLFLKRTGSDGSLHYTHLSPSVENAEERFASLPTYTETRVERVTACQWCFDLAHCLQRTQRPKPRAQVEKIPQPPKAPAPTPPLPVELESLAAVEPSEEILMGLFQTPSTPLLEDLSNEN